MSNLPSPEEMMRRACEVRDEDQQQANTARRVGALLADLVATVSSALPLTSWRVSRTAAALSVEYTVPADDGTAVKLGVELPAATMEKAGLMTAADKQALDNMPLPQDTASATAAACRYVYSVDDPQAKNSVLNAPDTLIKQQNGQLMFQKGLWNPLGQAIYYTRGRIPVATSSADGAMAREVFARLGAGYPLREYNPTTVKVPIVYPNWADGGTRTFDLLPATSARAGVMTAEDKGNLSRSFNDCEPFYSDNGELLFSFYRNSREDIHTVTMPVATTELPGVMSAADKRALDNMPLPQDTASATAAARRYVYSVNNPQAKDSVLNAPDTLIRQTNGQLKLQKGMWNPLGQAVYYTNDRVPVATTGADGAMAKEVFTRLGSGGTLREGTPTTAKVPVVYPDWAAGGTRTFDLLPATSARAGVMTAADKEKLDAASGVRALVYKSATASIESLSAGSDSDTIKAVFGGAADLTDAWNALRDGRALLFRTNGTGTAKLIAPALADISQLSATGGHRLALRFLTATEIKDLTVVCEDGTWRIE